MNFTILTREEDASNANCSFLYVNVTYPNSNFLLILEPRTLYLILTALRPQRPLGVANRQHLTGKSTCLTLVHKLNIGLYTLRNQRSHADEKRKLSPSAQPAQSVAIPHDYFLTINDNHNGQ